jgi:hypothetical protein
MQISCNCELCQQTNRPSQTKESPVNQQLVEQLNAELARLGFPTPKPQVAAAAPTTPPAQEQSAYLREEAERLVGQAERLLDQADELDAEYEAEDDGIGPQEQQLADNFLGKLDLLFKQFRVEQVPEGLLISDGLTTRVIVEWSDMFQVG